MLMASYEESKWVPNCPVPVDFPPSIHDQFLNKHCYLHTLKILLAYLNRYINQFHQEISIIYLLVS